MTDQQILTKFTQQRANRNTITENKTKIHTSSSTILSLEGTVIDGTALTLKNATNRGILLPINTVQHLTFNVLVRKIDDPDTTDFYIIDITISNNNGTLGFSSVNCLLNYISIGIINADEDHVLYDQFIDSVESLLVNGSDTVNKYASARLNFKEEGNYHASATVTVTTQQI